MNLSLKQSLTWLGIGLGMVLLPVLAVMAIVAASVISAVIIYIVINERKRKAFREASIK